MGTSMQSVEAIQKLGTEIRHRKNMRSFLFVKNIVLSIILIAANDIHLR